MKLGKFLLPVSIGCNKSKGRDDPRHEDENTSQQQQGFCTKRTQGEESIFTIPPCELNKSPKIPP